MSNNVVSQMFLAGSLILGAALTGCAALAAPVGLSETTKKALDDPLFAAELMAYGICPPTTTKFDDDATRCAAVLTRTTVNIASVHAEARKRGVKNDTMDKAAEAVNRHAGACDPEATTSSLRECLNSAEEIETNALTYVKTLRAMLDAVK